MDKLKKLGIWLLGLTGAVLAVWALLIGPVAVWRVITHGTTTVWDHLEYPSRLLEPSNRPTPWSVADGVEPTGEVMVDGSAVDLDRLLLETQTLAFVVIRSGEIVDEWYAEGHGPAEASMLFSVTKSILSLMIGAAIDDGLIDSVQDPVTRYLPEMSAGGLDAVTLEHLLRMDSSIDYVEDDNPFGMHVEFNYAPDLTGLILDLEVREDPDPRFRYKSGDNAVLGLVLDRVLGDVPITEYLQHRIWDPLGAESPGAWSTDSEDGLERTWCCLAMSARDLARFGVMVQNAGVWNGETILSQEWITESSVAGFELSRWSDEYEGSPLKNYGYHWWITDRGLLALGKNGQYLYVVDPDVVIVRLGEAQGAVSWVDVMDQVAGSVSGNA